MANISYCKRFTAGRSRRVTAVLSLVLLNLAMLPCAMALEQEPIRPCCPPDHAQHVDSHHEHASDAKSTHCHSAAGDCCDIDEFSIDDRSQKSGKDSAEQLLLVTAMDTACTILRSRSVVFPTGPPDPPPGAQRLHAIYCVYLD